MSFDSDGKIFKDKIFIKNRRETEKLRPSKIIKLPLTKHMLWSSVTTGPTVVVNLTYCQKPVVTVDLSAINTGFKSILKCSKRVLVCYLHGNIYCCADGEKLAISLGKLEILPECFTPFHEPISDNKYSSLCNMRIGENGNKCYQDVSDGSVQNMKRLLRSSKLDLGSILPSQVDCVFDEKGDGRVGCNVTFNCVIVATTFQAGPIQSLPILCTALSKSLADPCSQSSIHKEPKSGFLTMNEKRQLLLLLENDPKVQSLPLVGIWVNGVNSVRDIYTWRAALRYSHCDVPKEKIYNEAGCFLVLLYKKVDPIPAVYEFSIIEDLSVPNMRRLTAKQYFTFSVGNTMGKITLELQEADATTEIDDLVENRKEMIKDGSLKGKLQFTPDNEGDIAQNKCDKEIFLERVPRVFTETPATPQDLYQALAVQERELRFLRSQLDKLLQKREDDVIGSNRNRVSACTMTSNVWSPAPSKCSCGSSKRATHENPPSVDSNLESIHLGDVKMATANYTSPDTSVRIDLQDFSQSSLGLTFPSEYPNSQTSHMGSDVNSANDTEDEALYGNLLERINAMLGQQPYSDSDRDTTKLRENNPDEEDKASPKLPCESILLPKLQYASLWDAGKTFVDESALFDTLAVKYLRKKPAGSDPATSMSRVQDPSSVTVYGLGANNVSLATKDYLKKYKLL